LPNIIFLLILFLVAKTNLRKNRK